jgi:hypothetical protein
VYEVDDFYTVLHSIITACWKRASKGDKITIDELLEYLLDVEEYSLPKVTKPRRARGPGMKVDIKMYGYGTSTNVVLYSGLHDASSPIRDESSREGIQFRLDFGVPWSVFQTIIKLLDDKFAQRSSMHNLRDILFESCESWRACAIYASEVPWVNMLLDIRSTTVPSAIFF